MAVKQVEHLEKAFLQNLPYNIDKDFVKVTLSLARLNCITSEEKSYYLSRLNKVFHEGYSYVSIMSFLSELFFLAMIHERSRDSGRIIFPKSNKGDLQFLWKGNNSTIRIEVKAILNDSFRKLYQEFLNKVRQVPSGRLYSINYEMNFEPNASKEEKIAELESTYDLILNTIKDKKQLFREGKNKITVKDLNHAINSSKTGFIGPVYSFWINEEHLTKVIERKLTKQNKITNQIELTDIIALNIIDEKFDDEDISNALNLLQGKYNFKNKIFIYFSRWQKGKIKIHTYKSQNLTPSLLEFLELLSKK